MKILPNSIVGILGLGLGVIFDIALIFKFQGATPIPTFTIFGGIFLSLIFGVLAWLRKDRSWSLLVAVLPFGLFAVLWSLAEIVWPH